MHLNFWILLLHYSTVIHCKSWTNQWAIHIPDGKAAADTVAKELGYENHGEVCMMKQFFSQTVDQYRLLSLQGAI